MDRKPLHTDEGNTGGFRVSAQCCGGGFWGAGMLRSVEFAGEGTISRMFLDYDMYSSFSHGFEYIKSLARRYLLITWIIR